ncbi:hypothetical protein PCL_10069 [Purpureocillium lilacinum]|uniref:Uncharacterized protein n=1 Tax=Purpureocillium lilacinum TaxID=33203 RepID=A0A2U3EEW0_PURLI|nr:hypothetical protein PCL_10069 [Purpureocillium lilacinum]
MEHGRSLRRGLGGGAARIELPSGSGADGELPCLLVRPVRRCRAEKVGIRTLVLDRLRRAQTRCTAPPALLALRSSELSTSSMTGSRCFPNACTVVNGRNNHTERGSSTLSTQRLDADSVLLATQGQDKTLILGHLGARGYRRRATRVRIVHFASANYLAKTKTPRTDGALPPTHDSHAAHACHMLNMRVVRKPCDLDAALDFPLARGECDDSGSGRSASASHGPLETSELTMPSLATDGDDSGEGWNPRGGGKTCPCRRLERLRGRQSSAGGKLICGT